MRGLGLIGLVVALVIVGMLAKRQGAATATALDTTTVDAAGRRTPGMPVQQDVQRALEAAAQATRPDPDAQ